MYKLQNFTSFWREKLKKLEAHLFALLKFVTNVQSSIEYGTCRHTNRRGYRFFTILPTYTLAMKSIQIDARDFWRLVKQSSIESYTTGAKDQSELFERREKSKLIYMRF